MVQLGPHRAHISIPLERRGDILLAMIASRRNTQSFQGREETIEQHLTRGFRERVIQTLKKTWRNRHDGSDIVDRFMLFYCSLKTTMATAFHSAGHVQEHLNTTMKLHEGKALNHTLANLVNSEHTPTGVSLAQEECIFHHQLVKDSLTHPLIIALIACALGGPINAANTAFGHRWKKPDQSVTATHDVQNFHMEGDSQSFFDSFQVTMVWEQNGGESLASLSGNHHVFLTEDRTPRPLFVADARSTRIPETPLTIIYNSTKAAIAYDCEDENAVRNSISLNFQLSRITDDVLDILNAGDEHKQPKNLTELVTNFPTHSYGVRFTNMLLSRESLDAMYLQLSQCEHPRDIVSFEKNPTPLELLEEYKRENKAHIPLTIWKMAEDLPIAGTHESTASFLDSLCIRARRDVHLPLGLDMVPKTPEEPTSEVGRKFIRGLSGEFVLKQLRQYADAITSEEFTADDILPTCELLRLGNMIHHYCSVLRSYGYIDVLNLLYSIGTFALAIGKALDGLKEAQEVFEPHVTDDDTQIFRTRSLYLFWCADWLNDYIKKPIEGEFMIARLESKELPTAQKVCERTAVTLLRHWIAWGLFIEDLPKGGFQIRRSGGR